MGGGIQRLLQLTAAVHLVGVVPAVIDPVAEAAVGHAALVVAGPEPLPTAPVDCTHSRRAETCEDPVRTP